ncbi:SURF1 family protein [Motiliproteus sediminis]|uniref:SURF1 family protein n=1 Tax=Motiliproteus sediminis TaxID=1468178 RepID=UPI001AEF7C47
MALIAGVMLVPLLSALGGWQVMRGGEKARLLAALQSSEVRYQLPVESPVQPLRVELTGSLLPERYFLLDNRTRQGRVGYEVLAVLQLAGEPLQLLLNLGWVPAPVDRTQLPPLTLPVTTASFRGWLTAAEPGFRLDEPVVESTSAWPQRIQQPDWRNLSARLGVALYPGMLRVEQPYLAGAEIEWQPINMPPAKHYAYALQWFGLALMTAVWLLWWVRKEAPRATWRGDSNG